MGQGAVCTERWVLLVLVFVMTLSTTRVADRLFRSPCALLVPRIDGVAMNYVVIGGLILFLICILILDVSFRTDFTILAAFPPAVTVFPFTPLFVRTPDVYAGRHARMLSRRFYRSVPTLPNSFRRQRRCAGLFIALIKLIILPLILPTSCGNPARLRGP